MFIFYVGILRWYKPWCCSQLKFSLPACTAGPKKIKKKWLQGVFIPFFIITVRRPRWAGASNFSRSFWLRYAHVCVNTYISYVQTLVSWCCTFPDTLLAAVYRGALALSSQSNLPVCVYMNIDGCSVKGRPCSHIHTDALVRTYTQMHR